MFDVITDDDVVIAGLTFPGTGGLFVTLLKIFFSDGFRRKVMVAFDDNRLIAFCQDQVFAYDFHGMSLLNVYGFVGLWSQAVNF
jgi:hypothetical protein